jgi:hypothetical protein
MKKFLLLFLLLLNISFSLAQQDAWVYLTDKENVASSIANPITILTQEAIDRKAAHSVAIDERDVPVNENYITQLKAQTGITVMAKSKWFNAVHVRGTETDINALLALTFVDSIDFADNSLNARLSDSYQHQDKFDTEDALINFNYGNALNQIEMFNGDELHIQDYTGQGMTVAVLDAGFPNVNTMSSFQRLRDAGGLLGGYDFVNRTPISHTEHYHGTVVLSTMAGYIQDQYVGTAPDAQYYLFRTEDASSENPVEESYWVEAAERADSLGVDVINTSLGYTTYDNANYSYSPSNMNGTTAFISKGATIAFEKGMLLVNSAGNSGSSSWLVVGTPADSPGVLTVGAVDANGNYASFSSIGSSDQTVQKPDVVAQGQASYVIDPSDNITTSNGTSFSSPILAGGVVCLWQALPTLTNAEIMQLVRESASQYSSPDYYLGFGIPDLFQALNNGLSVDDFPEQTIELNIFPNPVSDRIYSTIPSDDVVNISIFDVLGKLVKSGIMTVDDNSISVQNLSKGIYIAKIQSNGVSKTIKLIKE